MSLAPSQWLSIVGGALLIVAPFLPVIEMDGSTHSLLGREREMDPLSALGGIAVLYGAAVILLSVWFATARHLIVPSVLGIIVTVIGALLSMGQGIPSPAWWAFLGGHTATLAAARIDARAHRRYGDSGAHVSTDATGSTDSTDA